jgi:hypothetical protein
MFLQAEDDTFLHNISTENLASHRTQLLVAILPNALTYGVTETVPEREQLKVVILRTVSVLEHFYSF